MPRLRFSANVSFLFPEIKSLLHRYEASSKCGFKGIECAFPYDHPVEDLVKVKEDCKLEQVLINAFPGSSGEMGLAALPGREKDFLESLERSIKYAKALRCKRLHIMAGKVSADHNKEKHNATYISNLKKAVSYLKQENMIGLIEPINQYDVPGYYLSDFDLAKDIIKQIDSPHLKLQLDIYHLQILSGNLSRRIKELMPMIGHIQVAQVPKRGHPGSVGEVNYSYIFKQLEELEYDGWIGLEYKPMEDDTTKEFKWISDMGYDLK